jgi:hypothetical protein
LGEGKFCAPHRGETGEESTIGITWRGHRHRG